MKDYNLAAIHDRIDKEHFEVHMHEQAIQALQRRVNELERTVDHLRRAVFERDEITGLVERSGDGSRTQTAEAKTSHRHGRRGRGTAQSDAG
jgi:predicted RNase H-like nuclease (RuvC/YqgF family)